MREICSFVHSLTPHSYNLLTPFISFDIILSLVSFFGGMFTDEPLPKDGYVELPDKPGFGVTLNREGLGMKRPYPRDEAK